MTGYPLVVTVQAQQGSALGSASGWTVVWPLLAISRSRYGVFRSRFLVASTHVGLCVLERIQFVKRPSTLALSTRTTYDGVQAPRRRRRGLPRRGGSRPRGACGDVKRATTHQAAARSQQMTTAVPSRYTQHPHRAYTPNSTCIEGVPVGYLLYTQRHLDFRHDPHRSQINAP